MSDGNRRISRLRIRLCSSSYWGTSQPVLRCLCFILYACCSATKWRRYLYATTYYDNALWFRDTRIQIARATKGEYLQGYELFVKRDEINIQTSELNCLIAMLNSALFAWHVWSRNTICTLPVRGQPPYKWCVAGWWLVGSILFSECIGHRGRLRLSRSVLLIWKRRGIPGARHNWCYKAAAGWQWDPCF
jgi:hypothetical protein